MTFDRPASSTARLQYHEDKENPAPMYVALRLVCARYPSIPRFPQTGSDAMEIGGDSPYLRDIAACLCQGYDHHRINAKT
jgi:hypothetical protein